MIGAGASFTAGFLLGQAWAVYVFRHAVGGADDLTLRFVVIVTIETVVAAFAFVFAARAGRLGGSSSAYLVALLAGFITNALTVGAYASIPVLIQGDAQLVLYVVAVGAVSAIAGSLLAKLFKHKAPHAA